MTQSLFAFLTALAVLFAPLFGCGQNAVLPSGLANELMPEDDGHSVYDKVDGVENSVFYIKRPDAEKYETVNAAEFGISENSYDNSEAFRNAMEYCRNNPYTKLLFTCGTYFFRNKTAIDISGLGNVIIDGSGSDFFFSYASYFNISDCDCLEITDIAIKHNDENGQLASLVKISNVDKANHSFDMEFIGRDNINENIEISAFTQYDSESLTPGVRGGTKENYIYSAPETIISIKKTSGNVLRLTHNGALDGYENGDVFLLRHHTYGGNVFNAANSENFTFSDIKIFAAAGMGWLITDRCSHFQIIDCTVGIADGTLSQRISSTADAVHIANTNGCFKIDGCDFGFMGDDAINVHDNVSVITEFSSDCSAVLYSNAPNLKAGDTVRFFDRSYGETGITARVVSFDGENAVFDIPVAKSVKDGYIVVNDSIDSGNYVITNNRFHENRARALLLQSSNGLCSNNIFYKTMGNAIKVVTDISNGNWLEGTGVNLLEISNNTFTDCNISDWGTQIDISTNINGKTASLAVFYNITVADNIFSDGCGEMLGAANVCGLTVSGNTVKNMSNRIVLGKRCSDVTVRDNYAPDSPRGVVIKLKSLSSLF